MESGNQLHYHLYLESGFLSDPSDFGFLVEVVLDVFVEDLDVAGSALPHFLLVHPL
jgi:hypothetical protein